MANGVRLLLESRVAKREHLEREDKNLDQMIAEILEQGVDELERGSVDRPVPNGVLSRLRLERAIANEIQFMDPEGEFVLLALALFFFFLRYPMLVKLLAYLSAH